MGIERCYILWESRRDARGRMLGKDCVTFIDYVESLTLRQCVTNALWTLFNDGRWRKMFCPPTTSQFALDFAPKWNISATGITTQHRHGRRRVNDFIMRVSIDRLFHLTVHIILPKEISHKWYYIAVYRTQRKGDAVSLLRTSRRREQISQPKKETVLHLINFTFSQQLQRNQSNILTII